MSFRQRLSTTVVSIVISCLFIACAGSVPEAHPDLFNGDSWLGRPIVRTKQGLIQGIPDRRETWVWKSVAYAKPPVGDLRWRAPRNPDQWSGVQKNSRFCDPCLQYHAIFKNRIHGSEDCLYLNIWRPQTQETDLPVYVWIHGGGNSIGSATFVPDYLGHTIANSSNLIFVSVNYRLGPFGWFSHPALRDQKSPEDASGNYGTLDLIQALTWIRQNIHAFGGDSSRVLITGESAGGTNVLSLLASPLTKGLFSAAMSQSGEMISSSPARGAETSDAALMKLLIGGAKGEAIDAARALSNMNFEEIRTFLRSVNGKLLLSTFDSYLGGMTGLPVLFRDGHVFPEKGYAVFESGEFPNKVPVIIGSNADETKLFLTFDSSIKWRDPIFQDVARYTSEYWKAVGVDVVARRLTKPGNQAPVYVYRFDWGTSDPEGNSPLPGNWGKRLGAFHTLEIPFFLGTDTVNGELMGKLLFTRKNFEGRKALSHAMMLYLKAFANFHDPNLNGVGLPVWKSWTDEGQTERCLVFDVEGNTPDIRMIDVYPTVTSIFDDIRREIPEPNQSRVLSFMQQIGKNYGRDKLNPKDSF